MDFESKIRWRIPRAGDRAAWSYASSAVSFIGGTAGSCYNSEAVASGATTVRDYAAFAANYAGETATNLWKSTTNSAEIERKENGNETIGDGYRGAVLAMSKNAAQYAVKTAGRSSNIVNIFDKTSISSLGNPRWWVRFDRPHGNVDFNHININKALTGLPDPHIRISPTTAKAAGYLGKVAEKANDVAPILMTVTMIYEAYRIGKVIRKDYDHGTTRNTIKAASTVVGAYAGASTGTSTGGVVGTTFFPGLGTIFGGLIGAAVGGVYGGYYSGVAIETALERAGWDTAQLTCAHCNKTYTWKKFEEASGICCPQPKL